MNISEPRGMCIARIERAAMILRYAVYVSLAFLVIFDSVHWHVLMLAAATAVLILHNSFVHAALLSGRIHWFQTPFNLALYSVEAVLSVWASGLSDFVAVSFAFLLLAGICVYASDARSVIAATIAFVLSLILVEVLRVHNGMTGRPVLEMAAGALGCMLSGILLAYFRAYLNGAEKAGQEPLDSLSNDAPALPDVLNSLEDAMLVCDETGAILEANQAACELFGLASERLAGSHLRTVLFDDGTLEDKLEAARQTGLAESEEAVAGASGEERHVHIQLRALASGGKAFYVAVAHSVSIQEPPQEVEAHKDIEPLGPRRRREWNTDFFVITAQRIRSPLSAILGYADLLLEEELGPLNHGQRNALQTSRRSARRIVRMLDEASASLPPGRIPSADSTPVPGEAPHQPDASSLH